MIWSYLALLSAILLGVGGQIMLKAGADRGSVAGQYLAPQSIVGLAVYFAAAVLYMFALRKSPVSVAFAAVSLSYLGIVAAGYWRYGEALSWTKLAGVALICSGVFLVSRHV